jgi:hypothetical protein
MRLGLDISEEELALHRRGERGQAVELRVRLSALEARQPRRTHAPLALRRAERQPELDTALAPGPAQRATVIVGRGHLPKNAGTRPIVMAPYE